ncbi:hypothetical protein KUTeg_025065 [Tegillarca granosa]|uniref:Chitin-binding type-1 domain-containing protein n=1 Tax=Tegillarca granosa TaxID=220873 RepID=A0ABQ9DZ07_TEGGR|nr:hypothetical protein KUTeg_025065 [Tegillarca granosa]
MQVLRYVLFIVAFDFFYTFSKLLCDIIYNLLSSNKQDFKEFFRSIPDNNIISIYENLPTREIIQVPNLYNKNTNYSKAKTKRKGWKVITVCNYHETGMNIKVHLHIWSIKKILPNTVISPRSTFKTRSTVQIISKDEKEETKKHCIYFDALVEHCNIKDKNTHSKNTKSAENCFLGSCRENGQCGQYQTGCDTTSALCGKGKDTVLKKIKTSPYLKEPLKQKFFFYKCSSKEVVRAGTEAKLP